MIFLPFPQSMWTVGKTHDHINLQTYDYCSYSNPHHHSNMTQNCGLVRVAEVLFSLVLSHFCQPANWTFTNLLNPTENRTEQEWTGSLPFSSVQFLGSNWWTEDSFLFPYTSKFPIYQIWIVSSTSWASASACASIKWDLSACLRICTLPNRNGSIRFRCRVSVMPLLENESFRGHRRALDGQIIPCKVVKQLVLALIDTMV